MDFKENKNIFLSLVIVGVFVGGFALGNLGSSGEILQINDDSQTAAALRAISEAKKAVEVTSNSSSTKAVSPVKATETKIESPIPQNRLNTGSNVTTKDSSKLKSVDLGNARVNTSANVLTNLPTATYTNFTKKINYGSRSADVFNLQRVLYALGFYTGVIDGKYGQATALAVRDFKSDNGKIWPTGRTVDADTILDLNVVVESLEEDSRITPNDSLAPLPDDSYDLSDTYTEACNVGFQYLPAFAQPLVNSSLFELYRLRLTNNSSHGCLIDSMQFTLEEDGFISNFQVYERGDNITTIGQMIANPGAIVNPGLMSTIIAPGESKDFSAYSVVSGLSAGDELRIKINSVKVNNLMINLPPTWQTLPYFGQ